MPFSSLAYNFLTKFSTKCHSWWFYFISSFIVHMFPKNFILLRTIFPYNTTMLLNWQWHSRIFSKTTGPISTKLGSKHPWVRRTQFLLYEGPRPSSRGDNSEITNTLMTFKNLLPNWASFNALDTNYPWVKRIQIYINKGSHLFLTYLFHFHNVAQMC